jgi:glycosyltransferase involved in cell wall biosynthesis
MNLAMPLDMSSVTADSGKPEGLPLVVPKKQAMGLPVMGSRHVGIPEIVEHGETGFLCPEDDSDTLADHILRPNTDCSLFRMFGYNGRKRVVDRFNLKTQTRALENIYGSHVA